MSAARGTRCRKPACFSRNPIHPPAPTWIPDVSKTKLLATPSLLFASLAQVRPRTASRGFRRSKVAPCFCGSNYSLSVLETPDGMRFVHIHNRRFALGAQFHPVRTSCFEWTTTREYFQICRIAWDDG